MEDNDNEEYFEIFVYSQGEPNQDATRGWSAKGKSAGTQCKIHAYAR